MTGVAQIERAQGPNGSADRTRISDLTAIIQRRPSMLLPVGYFLSVGIFARLRASRARARGDYLTWPRDESSRTASATAAAHSAAPPSGARPAVPWPACAVSRTAGPCPARR